MRRQVRNSFLERIQNSGNPVGLCVATLLAWVGFGDGKLTGDERDLLESLSQNGVTQDELIAAIDHAKKGHVWEIQVACEVVRHLEGNAKALLLELAVAIALADGRISNSESHLLLFFADLLDITPASLNQVFKAQTGSDFPIPGNVSSIGWWEQRNKKPSGKSNQRAKESSQPNQRIVAAMSTLGLEPGASQSDIRVAYLRLSKIHHPDRFHQLGAEAVAAATVTFKRIKDAYETLRQP